MVFGYFSRKRKNREIVDRLYRQLTQAARNPVYYAQLRVPDTVMGRFEMLSVIMVLFFRRTGAGGPSLQQLSQDVVDTFFEDMDHALRELGIGDVSVPKRMKRLAQMFYGRAKACGTALNNNDPVELAEVLHRNIYPKDRRSDSQGEEIGVDDLQPLARAVIDLDRAFSRLGEAELLDGNLHVADESISQEIRSNG
ncbi:ubiquinol-cytochrome C chaperone family protein [Hoeflea sp.]|uniref:ubiquinol-cytochrome C chaperone family protein n=1 Tax=Hoeflea sp. TaxID=1940281 RepID=UPI003B02C9E1